MTPNERHDLYVNSISECEQIYGRFFLSGCTFSNGPFAASQSVKTKFEYSRSAGRAFFARSARVSDWVFLARALKHLRAPSSFTDRNKARLARGISH
jgi:hypothetical protein